MAHEYEVVPGDTLLIEWADTKHPEVTVFVGVTGRNEDDVPLSYEVLSTHGLKYVSVDQVVGRGSNVFVREFLP